MSSLRAESGLPSPPPEIRGCQQSGEPRDDSQLRSRRDSRIGATAGSDGLTLMGSLRPEWTPDAGGSSLKVEVETIDRVVSTLGIKRIDLLKMDVEGPELDVIEGARETLALVDHLIIEYHSLDLGRRVIQLLTERGLTTVRDENQFPCGENMYPGVGRGLLLARRQADAVSRRSAPGVAVA